MKKPVNFETIAHSYHKILGMNFELRVEGTANIGNGDFTRVWLIGDSDTICLEQVGRAFYFDIFFSKNKCEVFAPHFGEGDNGPHIKDYNIEPFYFKTPDKFKEFLQILVKDLIDNFKLNDYSGISIGSTPLSILVKSDTDNGVNYSVDYVNGQWSCTCKGFVYSKAIPQTCKHILKTIN